MNSPSQRLIPNAIEALKAGDRRRGVALLKQELSAGDGGRDALAAVLQLATHISEIDLAVETARRIAGEGSIETLGVYLRTLASFGRSPDAVAEIRRQPARVREHPSILYLYGKSVAERGRFDEAEGLFRHALAKAPGLSAAWLAITTIKRFESGDPDIAAMELLKPRLRLPHALATLCYALGKAYEDCGAPDRAFDLYSEGAAIQRQQTRFDSEQYRRVADDMIATYNHKSLQQLTPSKLRDQRSLFVTGLARSGTTLTEQILRGHSAVVDGGEINLFGAALLPTRGTRLEDALAYEERTDGDDPWGEIGREYSRLLDMRFRDQGLVVDKSLSQSRLVGLMLHALPDARIAWLRRSPDDVALSCFRTHFDSGLEWTRSLVDIADYMRTEERLFEHWRSIFPERILAVPYEELVGNPAEWAERLQQHFGLPVEPGIEAVSRADRTIETASIRQAREPISAEYIGRASLFERQLEPFRKRYYG